MPLVEVIRRKQAALSSGDRVVVRKQARIVQAVEKPPVIPTYASVPQIVGRGSFVKIADIKNMKYGVSNYLKNAFEYNIPCTVVMPPTGYDEITHIQLPDFGIQKSVSQAVQKKDIIVISKQEWTDMTKTMNDKMKDFIAEHIAKQKKILEPEHVPINERRDYELSKKNYLATNINYITLYTGTIKNNIDSFNNASHNHGAVCCALTKTTRGIAVNIPVEWVRYFGYTREDFVKWLEFIKACEIGFDYDLMDKTPTLGSRYPANYVMDNITSVNNNNTYIYKDMPVYRLLINESPATMHGYIKFILVRYIYNSAYWNIPFVAMQIKDAVGDTLTHWECLLLAHHNQDYNGYYSIVNNTGGRRAMAVEQNSAKNILSRVRSNAGDMNGAFTYSDIYAKDVNSIRPAIQKQDYNTLVKIVRGMTLDELLDKKSKEETETTTKEIPVGPGKK